MELTIDQAIQKALFAQNSGDPETAAKLYKAILEVQPNNPDANHNLGVLKISFNKPLDALPLLKIALETNPNKGQYWIAYINALIEVRHLNTALIILEEGRRKGLAGESVDVTTAVLNELISTIEFAELEAKNTLISAIELREIGQYQEAEEWLDQYLKAHPNDPEAWSLLSQILLLDKQDAASEQALITAKRINPVLPSLLRNHARWALKKSTPEEALIIAISAYECRPNDPESMVILGACLTRNQRDVEALSLIERALKVRPDFAEAFANRALINLKKKDLVAAIKDLERAVTLKPHLSQVWSLLGSVRHQLRDLSGAIEALQKVNQLEPGNVINKVALGELFRQSNKVDEAIKILEEACSLDPKNANAWTNLGVALQQLGDLDKAKSAYEKSLLINPQSAEILSNLGVIERDSKNWELAKAYFEQSVIVKPDLLEAHSNLGATLLELRKIEDAEKCYQQAVLLKPDDAILQSKLGNILKDLRRYSEAELCYREAIKFKPDFAAVHSNLGAVLFELGKIEEAEVCFREAIKLNPDFVGAHVNLGNILKDLGRYSEADLCYSRAAYLKPDNLQFQFNSKLWLPEIYHSTVDIEEWRQNYQIGLKKLANLNPKFIKSAIGMPVNTFNLAYHNRCNLKTLKERSALAKSSLINIDFISPHILKWKKPMGRRIRIAFCSTFLVAHTIGKFYQGLIRKLDPIIFETIIIHTSGSVSDSFSVKLDEVTDKVVHLSPELSTQHEIISQLQLDILFYPDIGMDSETYHLAHARLAPIQIVSWGHPDTTGIDSIDYFISSTLIEPENVIEQYSESVIKLNCLPTYYERPIEPERFDDRAALGLPKEGNLYGCLQSLFKIHPDFDQILADILIKDSSAYLIFLEGKTSAWSNLLRTRWAASHSILNERVIFLPRQPMDKYMALMREMDVLLDPIHFGSGNTFYESMVYGVPTVTWPGNFMRGRIVAGAYKQMGIKQPPIAERLNDYAIAAVELGCDPEKKRALRGELREAANKFLYSDSSVIKQFEHFFQSAIDAADSGKKLDISWMSY